MKVYVDISPEGRIAGLMMDLFCQRLREAGADFRVYRKERRVVAEDKEFHFITIDQYETWCQGRTYYLHGELFKSGMHVVSGTKINIQDEEEV